MATSNRVGFWPLLICWALSAAALVGKALATAGTTPLILDTDDAMRLTRVHDLVAGQGWFDLIQHRLNTPYGAQIHWSRLVDVPEAALLLVLRPLLGGAADVGLAYAWPLLLLAVLLWLTARLALVLGGRIAVLPALLLPAFSLITMAEFAPGRLDHHNMQILLALAALLCTILALERPRYALGAGVAAGVALSIGIESLPIVGATIMAFGLAWVAAPGHAIALRDFGLSFSLATLLGLAQGVPPEHWFTPAADAISIVYALAAALCGLVFVLLSVSPLRSVTARLAAGAAGGGIALAAVIATHPPILRGPYGQLDPWLLANWIDRISEAEPFAASFAGEPVYAVAVAVPVIAGLAIIAWNIVRARQGRDAWLGREGWLVYGLILVAAFLLMLLQIRAARFAVPLAMPACAMLIGMAWQRMVSSRGYAPILALLGSAIASAGIAVALAATLILAAFPDYADATIDTHRSGRNACLMPEAFAGLAQMPPARIMTPIDLGSHMLLFTPHAVVAAPYHRNQQGVLDTFRFFNGPLEEGRDILARRGITMLVICPAMREIRGLVEHTPDSFVALFAQHRLPGWLHDISPPASALKIYSVEP